MARAWGQLFPWPFVGVVMLLVVLILITPSLLSAGGGAGAGSIEAQAELVVDNVPGAVPLHFYVHGFGMVRYTSISVAWVTNFSWPPSASLAGFNWTNRTTVNQTLVVSVTLPADPVALNVSAVYVDPSGQSVWYSGLYAFHLSASTLFTVDLAPGANPVSPTAVTNLPIAFPLTASSAPGST
ncbi:MAG TPA: hypothetical protein VEY07_07450 [Thermoplasmata archaeon]|nr:hypothetical protein [Thermoplasmata archaeon]